MAIRIQRVSGGLVDSDYQPTLFFPLKVSGLCGDNQHKVERTFPNDDADDECENGPLMNRW